MEEEWFNLDSIDLAPNNTDKLYCLSVDSPEKQFLIGEMGIPTHNTDEGKEQDKLKGEAAMIIGSIARLGRAAGVHLVIATQRPDATILSGELKANLAVRINCGRTNPTASSMILDSSEGARVKSNPRGRLYLSIHGKGDHGQGFFAEQEWINEYLRKQGLNPDGTPINSTKKKSNLAHIEDLSQLEGSTLDDREGIDNASKIEQLRAQEENDDTEIDDSDFDLEDYYNTDETNDTDDFIIESTNTNDLHKGTEFESLKLDGSTKIDKDKLHKPEDDWDLDLENLISENRDNKSIDDKEDE